MVNGSADEFPNAQVVNGTSGDQYVLPDGNVIHVNGYASAKIVTPDKPIEINIVEPTANDAECAPSQLLTSDDDQRAVIYFTPDKLYDCALQAEAILAACEPDIFSKDRAIVSVNEVTINVKQPVVDEQGSITIKKIDMKSLGVAHVSSDALLGYHSKNIRYKTYDSRLKGTNKWRNSGVPDRIVGVTNSRALHHPYRHLRGIVGSPTIRQDCSILSSPGYDEESGFFVSTSLQLTPEVLAIDGGLYTPEFCRERAMLHLNHIRSIIASFPYCDVFDEDTSRDERGLRKIITVSESVALSSILTVVTRGAFACVPCHVVDGVNFGDGKTFLCQLALWIATGTEPLVFKYGFPINDHSIEVSTTDAENEKLLISILRAGYPYAILDNVNGVFTGQVLATSITSPSINHRILGQTSTFHVDDNRLTILANGVKILPTKDLMRRIVKCNLDTRAGTLLRSGPIADPKNFVLTNRASIVSSCIAIIKYYYKARRPGMLPALDNFDHWSSLVPSALVWLGCPNPVSSQDSVKTFDFDLQTQNEFVHCLDGAIGRDNWVSAADIYDRLDRRNENGSIMYPGLREICDQLAAKNICNSKFALSKILAKFENKPDSSGRAIRIREKNHSNQYCIK